MIKFFRKIRQKLFTDGKFRKYLIYAIGEIILVVVGILIALQINSWNNKRIAQKEIHSNLSLIISDLTSDTLMFNRGIQYYKNILLSKERLLSKKDLNTVGIEELKKLLEFKYNTAEINDNAFKSIKNINFIKLPKKEKLAIKTNNYYTAVLNHHNTMMEWDKKYTNKEADYYDYEQNIYEVNSPDQFPVLQGAEENKKQLILLLTSPKGRNHLKQEYYRKSRMVQHFEFMYQYSTTLLAEIQMELAQTE